MKIPPSTTPHPTWNPRWPDFPVSFQCNMKNNRRVKYPHTSWFLGNLTWRSDCDVYHVCKSRLVLEWYLFGGGGGNVHFLTFRGWIQMNPEKHVIRCNADVHSLVGPNADYTAFFQFGFLPPFSVVVLSLNGAFFSPLLQTPLVPSVSFRWQRAQQHAPMLQSTGLKISNYHIFHVCPMQFAMIPLSIFELLHQDCENFSKN